jgi:MoaA/NifB/PqqE/SkfB family radical SAM enzyme
MLGFKKTVEAIKIVKNSGIEVSVRYSLCRSNLNDVVKTYQFVSSLGGSKFKFRVLFPDGRAKNRLVHELISGEEMAIAQYDLIHSSAGNKTVVEITQPCFFKLPDRHALSTNGHFRNVFKEACPCGTTAAYIDSNGDVKYCLFDENILGNVFEDSFLNIWNSITAINARENRCPLDISGCGCSSFKILFSQFGDYSLFMKEYINEVKSKPFDFMLIT